MNSVLYSVVLQWKLDLRNKGVLLTYYIVPLIFFVFMGAIFTSINPEFKDILIQSMIIFAITMGAFLGTPIPLVEFYSSEMKKAYKVGGIPLWIAALVNFISAFIHLMISSIIIYIIAQIAFSAKTPDNIVLFFFSLSIFTITSLSIGTTLGLYIKNTTKLTMLSQLIFLPSLMLSGIMFPTNLLPSVLETAGKIFPATWGLKIMTSSELNFTWFAPLIIIIIITTCANWIKLSRIGKD